MLSTLTRTADHKPTVLPDRTVTPPSPAVETASQRMSSKTTPGFDPEVHKSMGADSRPTEQTKEDAAESHEQSNDHHDAEIAEEWQPEQTSGGNGEIEDDSFVEQIKTRTPAKPVSRIEDSVEALDALEDEIERIGEAIPATTGELLSPTNVVKKPASTARKAVSKKSDVSLKTKKGTNNAAKADRDATYPRSAARTSFVRPNAVALRPSTTRSEQDRTNASPESSESVLKPARGSTKRSSPPSKRLSSIHKAPFQPIKSNKPPTKSTFELPGEAVARKLKEQREERQKREEEEQGKQRKFKARPVRISQAPEVKLTAATKARLSLAKNALVDDVKYKAGLRTGAASAVGSDKRQSTITVAKRTAPPTVKKATSPSANASMKRGPSLTANAISRQPSVSAPPSVGDLAQQKLKGKEVFGRPKVALSERENEKKGKEEAAKKARAEAAERGRTASREWAEKQKAKKLAASKMKEKDEGEKGKDDVA